MSAGAWITLGGSLAAMSCALLGSFLVVRRMSLLTDATAHAVLPGIVAAWLVVGTRSVAPMIVGATAFAVACVLLIGWLRHTGLVRRDAAIALAFPAFFSLGVLGVHRWAGNVHLDLDSTVYGEIAFLPLVRMELLGEAVPRGVVELAAVFLVDLAFVAIAWKQLVATSFDEEYAASVGVRTRALDRTLLVLVAVTAVIAFESVGAILVVTLFIVPATTALLLARRMSGMVVLATAIGATCAVLGWQVASVEALDLSVAGMMGVSAGALFTVALAIRGLRSLAHRHAHVVAGAGPSAQES